MLNGKLTFVGAGPGAPDLITMRGAARLREADTVVYAGSLVNEKLLDLAPDAVWINSAKLSLEEVLAILIGDYHNGKKVVRLHTGDPAMYGAVSEQYRVLEEAGIPYDVVPGVSSVFAAAAALKVELTMPDVSQSVILSRAAGRTPVPEREAMEHLASHGTTLCVFLSVGDLRGLCDSLMAAGRAPDTPVAVVYRASWENERIVRGPLSEIAVLTERAGIKRQAMIVVGEVLRRGGSLSKLYDAHFATGFRHHRFHGRVGIFALTRQAVHKSVEIATGVEGAELWIPRNNAQSVPSAVPCRCFDDGGFGKSLEQAWLELDGLILVMAAGIAVRYAGKLCRSKQTDPAVVVCDERGDYAISLLSGHLGGGNDLARDVSRVTGGRAVITTASDVEGLPAFDEFARHHRARIVNPESLTLVAASVVDGCPISLEMPRRLFESGFAAVPQCSLVAERDDGVMWVTVAGNTLELRLPVLALGIGCRKGVSAQRIEEVVTLALDRIGLEMADISLLGSAAVKAEEPGLLTFAGNHHWSPSFFTAERLNSMPVPNPSDAARRELGIHSVSEASALLAAGQNALLILEKFACQDVTVAVAERKL